MYKQPACAWPAAVVLLALVAGPANAEGPLSVRQGVVVTAPPGQVWSVVGDFSGLHRWHPAVTESELESGNGTVEGSIRVLTLDDGATITEVLQEYDDEGMSYTYAITESPLPVSGYVATISVRSLTEQTTSVSWESSFGASGVEDYEARQVIRDIYFSGLTEIARQFR